MVKFRNAIVGIVCCLSNFSVTGPVAAQSIQNQLASQNDMAARQANQPFSGTVVPSNPYANDGINESPWYTIPAIAEQLNLTETKIDQLNYAYGQAWGRYNEGLYALQQNLSEPQRIQRQQDLSAAFHRDLTQSIDNIFTDPTERVRFDQLYLQYRWYTSFNDQFIQQQLNLTNDQDLEFRQLDADWNEQMAQWYEIYPVNRIGVTIAFNRSRYDFNENVYSILSPQQYSLWQTLVGEPFEFAPDDYFTY